MPSNGSLVKPDRLNEGAIAGRVPHGESHPRLPFRIEGKGEVLRAERRQIGRRNDLTIDRVPSPHTTSTKDSGNVHSTSAEIVRLSPVTFDAVRTDQDLAGGHEETAVA